MCNPNSRGCTCTECCATFLLDQRDCDTCVASSLACESNAISSPAVEEGAPANGNADTGISTGHAVLLLIGVAIPYFCRSVGDLSMVRVPRFRTCLDRPFVQMEIREAKERHKNAMHRIFTVYEDDVRKQGYFDVPLAWEKYGNTDWAFLLHIDMITYRRDVHETDAMVSRILEKARAPGGSGAPPAQNPRNAPGRWDFFISHG
eukprot:COSAG02_NODE_2113_length_9800_cov_53.566643_7_plen_204_part_00